MAAMSAVDALIRKSALISSGDWVSSERTDSARLRNGYSSWKTMIFMWPSVIPRPRSSDKNSLHLEFSIDRNASLAFAQLSGDFNPLHLDVIAARRTQFGRTIVNGIHLLLRAIDGVSSAWRLEIEPHALSISFNNPVRTGARVTVRATRSESSNHIHISAQSESRMAFSASLELQATAITPAAEIIDANYEFETPIEEDFPPCKQQGEIDLRLHESSLALQFPALARAPSHDWIADLLATTRVVGMKSPGLHSIYGGCKLQRLHSQASGRSLTYTVARTDPRFRSMRLEIRGARFEGTLNSFFRPRPVTQSTLVQVMDSVPRNAFTGHRALVVGGSRGLGELTAKLLLAGGSEVTITYASGQEDAERVCAEAQEQRRSCSPKHLDVLVDEVSNLPDWLADTAYSHVYFFATPPIAKNATGLWDHALYERFVRVYVKAFELLVRKLLARHDGQRPPPRFMYPSSIFLDQPEKGFSEYAAAKAAGEMLCDYLAQHYKTSFQHPRLPRMLTDQTISLLQLDARDPLPVMLALVRAFHS
jgi:acyl dehydratase